MYAVIIGAGLAGSEAAWQLVKRGIRVELYEMRPQVMTKAHRSGNFAELVCSNSLRGAALTNAVGLLKEELRLAGSLIMEAADVTKVPAGGALAVDRDAFSQLIDDRLRSHPLITVHTGEVSSLPEACAGQAVVVAAGPLCAPALARAIRSFVGHDSLSFYDAIAPVVLTESLNHSKIFKQSRYGKGSGDDYWNVPLNDDEYRTWVQAITAADKYDLHADIELDVPAELRPFEGCMPIEDMVERGPDTLRFGPLKPIGLTDPNTGRRPFAVVQLRAENNAGTLCNLVGMQTRMRRGDQERVFKMLPGFEQAEFVRWGSVHRNTFIQSPRCLNATLEFRTRPGLFFAGQMTGVEGYVESTAGGLAAGLNAVRFLKGEPLFTFPNTTAIGALLHYISDPERKDFQPMNVNFGLIPSYFDLPKRADNGRKISNDERRLTVAEQALKTIQELEELR